MKVSQHKVKITQVIELGHYRPNPSLEDAIEMAQGLTTGSISNPEYVRGQVELIIDLFAIADGMDSKVLVAKAMGISEKEAEEIL